MDTTKYWLAAGFICFFLLFGKKIWQALSKPLKEHGEKVAQQLDEAKKLREEAQVILATSKREQREAEKNAQDLIDQANAQAAAIKEKTLAQLDEEIAMRTESAKQQIAQAELNAKIMLQQKLASLSISASEIVLTKELHNFSESFAQDAIEKLPTRRN